MEMKIKIRQEIEADHSRVYEVVREAFLKAEHADGDEQDLVNRLRTGSAFIKQLSLVAVLDGIVIGHIMFTKLPIGNHMSLALAPVSVLPQYQKMGIGGQLIKKGHQIAKRLGYESIIVLGHAAYYPRFGYQPASKWGITPPFPVPDEAFMGIELTPGALKNVHGTVEYAKEFFPINLTD